jgi:hypothetical protein
MPLQCTLRTMCQMTIRNPYNAYVRTHNVSGCPPTHLRHKFSRTTYSVKILEVSLRRDFVTRINTEPDSEPGAAWSSELLLSTGVGTDQDAPRRDFPSLQPEIIRAQVDLEVCDPELEVPQSVFSVRYFIMKTRFQNLDRRQCFVCY